MIADEPIPTRDLGGRPQFDLDLEVIRNSAAIGCTVDEIAAVLGIARSTLYLHMERDATVQDAIDTGRDKGRATLRRNQWQKATAGSDTMLIWLGKQMLNQRDKSEHTGADGGAIVTETVYRWADPPKPGNSE